jgi:ribosomal protein L40E
MTQTPAYVICLKCGTHNPPGEDFCKNCGAYLPFEGIPGGDTAPTEEEEREALPIAAVEQPETPPAVGDDASDAGGTAGVPPRPEPPAGDRPAGAAPGAGPALRKPAAAAAPRPRPASPQLPAEPAAAPDDVICASCGTRNRPDRRFCRRCANPLWASSPLAGAPMQPAAGTRPKTWNTRFPFTAVVVLLVLLGLLVVAWLNRDVVIGFVETIVGFVFSSQSP